VKNQFAIIAVPAVLNVNVAAKVRNKEFILFQKIALWAIFC